MKKPIHSESTPIAFDTAMRPEVWHNRHLIRPGDVLWFDSDPAWTVTDVFEGGFEARDDYETRDFYFNELQIGWRVSEKTKRIWQEAARFSGLAVVGRRSDANTPPAPVKNLA